MNVKKILLLISFTAAVFLCDVFSKSYTHYNLPLMNWSSPVYPYGGISVFQNWHGIDFSINHVMNKGAAWGILSAWQDYLLYLRVAIIGGLLTYVVFFKLSFSRRVCFALITTGAIGNVVDYFVYGHVIDMFHFVFWGYSFPVFNIADSAIFCGISWILMQSLFVKLKPSKSSKNLKTQVSR